MNYNYDQKEAERVADARESFSGRLLTDAQFDESMAITGIIEREIRKSGSFKEKLGDYAYAFSRTENFDAGKAETVIRDLFKARTGQSMNQMREDLAAREDRLTDKQKSAAFDYAIAVGTMIETGEKMSFNRAFAHQGQVLAEELGITDVGAKRLMKDEFKAAQGTEFYDWGKDLEDKYYRPQIEAEKDRSADRAERDERSNRRLNAGRSRRSSDDEAGRSDKRIAAEPERQAPRQSRMQLRR